MRSKFSIRRRDTWQVYFRLVLTAMHRSSIVTINYCDFLLTGSLHLSVYDEDESLLQGHLDIPKSAISERWTGLPLCPSRSSNDFVKKYLTFSGTPGLRFTVEASQDYEIELNEVKTYHIFEWKTVNVFHFTPPKDISKTQLDITVTSESDVSAYLKVSRICQDVNKDNIRNVDYRGESIRLSFAKKGRITLSKVSTPSSTDSTAGWYIGLALNNAAGTTPLNASKTGTLTVTRSFNYSYGGPMSFICLVPFFFGGIVAVWALYCFKEPHVSPWASHIEPVTRKDVCRAMCKVLCTYWFAGGHKTYSYITCIVGSVLMVGAFQFVYANWYLMIQEGDRDDCYYNDLCYRVSNYDIPFNSMSSNFVYIVHAFILALSVWYMEARSLSRPYMESELLARCKKITENAECNSTEVHKRKISFSICYAFSWALLFEGLFSMLYHLCPTKMTFQFDLAFMFVISGLIVVVMYNGIQLNHAGETGGHVGASNFYLGFIVPLYILNYLGSLNHSKEGLIPTAAWATPLALWVFFIFNWVGYKLYLSENWSVSNTDTDFWNCMRVCKFSCLMIGLILAVLMFSLFSVTTFKFIGSLPHALLFACITESVIVICWKLGKSCYCLWRDGRYKIFFCVIIYVSTTLALGSSALVFFTGFPTTDKAETPEISRNKNHKCIIKDFYDYYDLWHILSSFALLMGVHIVMFASDDRDTIARGDVISNYGATTSDVACEPQTHFRSSFLSLFFGGRETTTGNASAVRRLHQMQTRTFELSA